MMLVDKFYVFWIQVLILITFLVNELVLIVFLVLYSLYSYYSYYFYCCKAFLNHMLPLMVLIYCFYCCIAVPME